MMKPVHRLRRRGALFVAMSLSIGLTAACSRNKSAEDYIHSAQAHREKREISAAIIDLKNALQKEPKNLTARSLLAQYYLDLPDPTSAEAELQHARQDGADAQMIAVPLARAALMLGRPDEVLQDADVAAQLPPEGKAGLLALRAEAYLAMGRSSDAETAVASALSADPHSPLALTAAARYALAHGDAAAAQARVEEAEKAAPDDPSVLNTQGIVAFARSDYPASDQAYQKMMTVAPWNLVARMGLARAQIGEQKLKEADENIDAVLKTAPNDPRANYLRSLSAYREGDFTTAKARSERALNAAKNYGPALLIAGAASYALHQNEQANNYLSQYVYQTPSNLQARKLLASVQVALGHSSDAVKTLSPALDQASNDPQLLAMLGGASARAGDLASANSYYSKAVEKQPANAELRADLGVTEVALGRADAGIKELEQAAEQDPAKLQPEMALFVNYLRAKNYGKALEVADRLQKAHPDLPIGFNYAGIAYAEKGDLDAAQTAFEKAHELKPGDPAAARSLAALAIRRNDLDAASRYYEEVLQANPSEVQTYIDLAALEGREGHDEQMRTTLDNAIAHNPDNPAPRIVLGRFLLLRGQASEALKTVQPALAKNPTNSGLLEIAGRAQLLSGHIDNAQSTFRTLADTQPESAAAHQYLAEAYAASKNFDLATAQANQAITLDPNGLSAKILLARVEIAAHKYDDARKLLDGMASQWPKDAQTAELQGEVALTQNRVNDALAAFQRGLAANDNSLNRSRLARAQARAGHLADAEQTLQSWLSSHPDDPITRLALGDIYLGANSLDDAKAQYAAVVAKFPNNAIAQNNLAWTLAQQGDKAEALDHAQHAAQLAPTSPDVLDTLGVVLLDNQKPQDAAVALKKASAIAPDNPGIQFHLAQALDAAGDKGGARGILRSLLGNTHPFDERAKAEKLLQQLGS